MSTSDSPRAGADAGHRDGAGSGDAGPAVAGAGLAPAELARLRRARDLIDREFARPLDVATVARAAHLSPSHFTRRYREVYGETPHQHLLGRRLERARALLRAGEASVTEVCLAVGFTSLGTFSARFRERTGCSPSEYRRAVAGEPTLPGCALRGLGRVAREPESERRSRAARDRLA